MKASFKQCRGMRMGQWPLASAVSLPIMKKHHSAAPETRSFPDSGAVTIMAQAIQP
jgi:hypothetical protein